MKYRYAIISSLILFAALSMSCKQKSELPPSITLVENSYFRFKDFMEEDNYTEAYNMLSEATISNNTGYLNPEMYLSELLSKHNYGSSAGLPSSENISNVMIFNGDSALLYIGDEISTAGVFVLLLEESHWKLHF